MKTEVLVIGGGIAGLSIAWSFARKGMEVTVADPYPGMGCGASGASGGILFPPLKHRLTLWGRVLHAAWDCWDQWRCDLEKEAGFAIGWNPCGIMRIVQEKPLLLPRHCQWMSLNEQDIAPLRHHHGAIVTTRGGQVQALDALAALRTAIARRGGQFALVRVNRIAVADHGWIIADSDDETVIAERVVIAAGEATPDLVASLNGVLPVRRDSGATLQLIDLPRLPRITSLDRWTVASKPDGSVYLTGAHWGESPPHLTLERLADLWEGAVQIFHLQGTIRAAWTGVRMSGPGSAPVIEPIRDHRIIVVCGLGRNGFLAAPALGALAYWALHDGLPWQFSARLMVERPETFLDDGEAMLEGIPKVDAGVALIHA